MNRFFKYLFPLLLLFIISPTFAQNYNVDSIIKIAQSSKNDSVKFSEYRRALSLYKSRGNFQKADSILNLELQLSNAFPMAKSYYLMEKDQVLQLRGKYAEVIESFFKAMEIAEKKKHYELHASLFNDIGMIHFSQEEYDQALNYYIKAVDLLLKNNKQKGLRNYYNNIGNIYYITKKYTKAFDYYNKALELVKKSERISNTPNFLNNIGSAYMELKDYDQAMRYFLEAHKIVADANRT